MTSNPNEPYRVHQKKTVYENDDSPTWTVTATPALPQAQNNRHSGRDFKPMDRRSETPRFSNTSRYNEADEAASVSSMSSTSRANLCRKCSEPAVERVKPLVQCFGCMKKWHPICHRPAIDMRFGEPVLQNWQCQRCQEKLKAANVSPPRDMKPEPIILKATSISTAAQTRIPTITTPTPHNSVGSSAANTMSEPNRESLDLHKVRKDGLGNFYSSRECERIGCTRPVVQKSGIDNWKAEAKANRLCKQHEMEEQHKRASAKKSDVAQQHGLSPKRAINKKKLYKKSVPVRQSEYMDDGLYPVGNEAPSNVPPVTDNQRSHLVFQSEPMGSSNDKSSNDLHHSKSIDTQVEPVMGHLVTPGNPSNSVETTQNRAEWHKPETTNFSRRKLFYGTKMAANSQSSELSSSKTIPSSKPRKIGLGQSPEDDSTDFTKQHLETKSGTPLPPLVSDSARNTQTMTANARDHSQKSLASQEHRSFACPDKTAVGTSSIERAEDDHCPSYQLESEFRASGGTVEHSSSTLTSLVSTPRETASAAEDGGKPATATGDTEMPDVGDQDPTEDPKASASSESRSAKHYHGDPQATEPMEIEEEAKDLGETERYKRRYMKSIADFWGEDFHTKLPAWPNPAGKTFLEHIIKLCKVENMSLETFNQGITQVFNERVALSKGRGTPNYIKISDVKEFLARYQEHHNQANDKAEEPSTQHQVDSMHLDGPEQNGTPGVVVPSELPNRRVLHSHGEDMSRAKMPPPPARFQRSQQAPRPKIVSSHNPSQPLGSRALDNRGEVYIPEIDHTGFPQQPDRSETDNPSPQLDSSALDNKGEVYIPEIDRTDFPQQLDGSPTVNAPTLRFKFGSKRSAVTQEQATVNRASPANTDDFKIPDPAANSVEAKRKQKAAVYDERILDDIFGENRNAPLDEKAWGHIDPRIAWRKRTILSEDFLAAKRTEIEARGNRKHPSRFGKVLRPETVAYRKAMGWHKHQNKEASDEWKNAQGAIHIQELFGVPDPATLEPVFKDGKLHMSEPNIDANGGKRRKAAIRSWPVLSAD